MTVEKLITVLGFYYDNALFTERPPIQLNDRMYAGLEEITPEAMKRHLRGMIDQCLYKFIPPGHTQDIEKAHRWLGYIQGELRAMGKYSINQMREHSRS